MFIFRGLIHGKKKRHPVKKALLIGLNYRGTSDKLDGCENDISAISSLLEEQFGYSRSSIELIKDHDITSSNTVPMIMKRFLSDSQEGDELYLHYSGHGSQVQDLNGDEEDGLDEAIYTSNGFTSDDEINTMFRSVPPGVRVTAVFDCCHSGTIADLRYRYLGGNLAKIESNKKIPADVMVISGCRDDQTSADAYIYDKREFYGALTSCMTDLCKEEDVREYGWLIFIGRLQDRLKQSGYRQVPQLSSNLITAFNGAVNF